MIRSSNIRVPGVGVPGSVVPRVVSNTNILDSSAAQRYLESSLWEEGLGFRIVAAAGSGKTNACLELLRGVHKQNPSLHMSYWTEYDFLNDLKVLWRYEDLTSKHARDDALWAEYLEWDRSFTALKECPLLFLDDVGRGYTAMHLYEVESLLRLRMVKALPTVIAVQTDLWENLPHSLRSVISRSTIALGGIEEEGW